MSIYECNNYLYDNQWLSMIHRLAFMFLNTQKSQNIAYFA